MQVKPGKIEVLIADIEQLIAEASAYAKTHKDKVGNVHPAYKDSALNLLHYAALRKKDLSRIQKRLGNMGLSRLGKAESHILPSLLTTLSILHVLSGLSEDSHLDLPELSIKKSKRRLKKHVQRLLGKRPKGRSSRIMVTMPAEAAENPELIVQMMRGGMNVARINCAHDAPKVWKRIIDNIHNASKELQVSCVISMDLAGPKIRTGAVEQGPQIRKIRPRKNVRGKIVKAARLWLGPTNEPNAPHYLPLTDFSKIREKSFLHFRDTRNKQRVLKILEVQENGCWAAVKRTSYFETGMPLFLEAELIHPMCTIGDLPHLQGSIYLAPGDHLRLVKKQITASHRSMGSNEEVPRPIEMHCTNSAVLAQVKEGESVLFDDGKIGGIVIAKDGRGITIKINTVRLGGAKLRADKGINFPQSDLKISGLTEKDRQDLKFVTKHADVVNMSFVNTPHDVEELLGAIEKTGKLNDLGVILKIETQKGFSNLVDIILAGMRTYPMGIMTARGDLALEVGWQNIAIIQREIMKLCHAAHVPDIWATQVFENLAKTGVPSRAEMTDVWVAKRSESVMLNKGPYIIEAIALLDVILTKMEIYHQADSEMLPSLKKASD
jgi:pyruvate kinase